MADDRPEPLLEHVDSATREFLRKVALGTALVAPIVPSLSMERLAPREAFAQSTTRT
jgi:hypothetical protein